MPSSGQTFGQIKFLGCTVKDASASGGAGNQQTQVAVTLIEDPQRGDRYAPPSVGEPVKLELGSLTYEGLLQHQVRVNDFQGNPTYQVTVVDPREILDGAQVIVGAFTGTTSAMPNLLNAYGLWESVLGFGGAMTNESGMLWDAPFELIRASAGQVRVVPAGNVGIRPAVESMTATATAFGGPIQFRGHSYRVDFSGLPQTPGYYRPGTGVAATIKELVDHVCEDAGCDYLVRLDGHTIRFTALSKTHAPAIGAVASWVESQTNVVSKSVGTELANEYTNSVLIGDAVQTLNLVYNSEGGSAIWPYWGDDAAGVPIWGQGVPEQEAHTFDLDCAEIAELIGSTSYASSLLEMRFALVDYDSWAAYVIRREPDKAEFLGICTSVDAKSDLAALFPDLLFRRDLLAVDRDTAALYGQMNETEYWTGRAQRIYDFVRGHAVEYLGRKFLVRLPFFVQWKIEPETTHIVKSDEPSDGGYLSEGSSPLGLPFLGIDQFLTDDGRYACFVGFPLRDDMNIQLLDPADYLVAGGTLYLRGSLEDRVVYPPGQVLPYVILTLADAVTQVVGDPLGGIDDLATVLGVEPEVLVYAAGLRHGTFPVRIHPAPFRPGAAAIPSKSNRLCYGPWGTFPPWGESGPPGKVLFQRDESLNPWSYGDIATMDQAAVAMVSGAITRRQEVEAGSVTLAELPRAGLGEVLVAGGPYLTGVRAELSTAGIQTTYEMRTYTPVFGAFSQANATRLRRLGVAAQQTRRSIRALFARGAAAGRTDQAAALGWMENASHAVAQRSPHEAVMATMTRSATQGYRTQASLMACDELLAGIRADDDDAFKLTGGMTLEGLLRPFSTGSAAKAGDMPRFEAMARVSGAGLFSTVNLDPIRDSDIDLMVNGASFDGRFHSLKSQLDYDNARGVGLRGPLVLVGWGLEYTGKPLPNSGDESLAVDQWSTSFRADPQLHPERWRAGVVALHWDDWRKVWTVPTILRGDALQDIASGSAGMVQVKAAGQDVCKLSVQNDLGATVKSGSRVEASYYALENAWYVSAAACPP